MVLSRFPKDQYAPTYKFFNSWNTDINFCTGFFGLWHELLVMAVCNIRYANCWGKRLGISWHMRQKFNLLLWQKVSLFHAQYCNFHFIAVKFIGVLKISSENTTPKLLKTASTKTWDIWIVITKTQDNQSLRPWIGLVGYVWETVGLE